MTTIARIAYTNTEPFFYQWPADEFPLHLGVPRALAQEAREGHVDAGRTRSHTLSAVGTLVGVGLSAAGVPAAGLISGLGVDLIDASFDRDQEREADALSIDYAIANNYDPWAAIRLHEKFLKIDRGLRLPFLSSHPSSEERIKNLKAVIEAKQSSR